MKKERAFYLDFVRVLSMILIVVFHFNCAVNDEKLLGDKTTLMVRYTNGELGQVGVALFFIISGASLMYVYEKDLSLIKYFKKRFIKIYPMFYIAYIGAFLYLFYVNKVVDHSSPKWTYIFTILGVDGYVGGMIHDHYILGEWFLGCIIILYIIFPLLRKIILKFPKILFVFTVIFYIVFVQKYNFNTRIDWNVFTRIPDFLVGMYFIKYIKKVNVYEFFIALAVTMVMLFIPLNIKDMYKVTIMGISSFFVLLYISKCVSNRKIQGTFEGLSKYSYAVFLIHHVVLLTVVSNFKGKVLSYSEVMCVFLIVCIMIGIISVCLYKLDNKVVKCMKSLRAETA